jgi:hypothetical protein
VSLLGRLVPLRTQGHKGHDRCGINSVALAIGMAAGAWALLVGACTTAGYYAAGIGTRGDAMTYCSWCLIVLGERSRLITGRYIGSYYRSRRYTLTLPMAYYAKDIGVRAAANSLEIGDIYA